MHRRPSTEPAESERPLDWCRARYLAPGQPLALTLPYAEPGRRDALLALNSVIGEIAAVPGQVSDAEAASRTLAWWREALTEHLPHPAIGALAESGAAAHLPPQAFDPLLAGVAGEIDPPRFERCAELVAHAERVAGSAAGLEARLIGAGTGADADSDADADPDSDSDSGALPTLAALAGAGYRVRVVRDLVTDARAGRWMVPLELQAEYQITRAQVAAGEHVLRRDALIRHLAGDALQTLSRAADGLDADLAWQHRHALLRAELDRRLGLKILRDPARAARARLAVTGPRAAFALWRRARRLRRAASTP